MFTIEFGGSRDCTGLTRRNFLRVGGLGLGGLTLTDLIGGRSHASDRSILRDKSVVFLYLGGGPSQFETFDPKMTAPESIRSMTGETPTRIPGVTFGGTFPRLAAMADRLAIVRSFSHNNSGHDGGQKLFGGSNPANAHWGAIYARMAGATHPTTGMMSNVFVSPMSVGFAAAERYASFYYSGISQTGALPASVAPFQPRVAGAAESGTRPGARPVAGLLSDMQLRIPAQRLNDRNHLVNQLDSLQRQMDIRDDVLQSASQYNRQAMDVLLRGVRQAFDLSREDPRVVDRYDTSRFQTPIQCLNRDRNGKMPAQSQTALGRQMLLARRLCEAGCGFITVGMNDWDMHANNNSFSILEGMPIMGGALDKAVSAFLTDLRERGLEDQVLLVMTGEMGRTPRISAPAETGLPGRDHWGDLGPLVLAGGGYPMGQVIGASDRTGSRPATDPITTSQLQATIWHTLFNLGELRVAQGLPTDLARHMNEIQPIRELVG